MPSSNIFPLPELSIGNKKALLRAFLIIFFKDLVYNAIMKVIKNIAFGFLAVGVVGILYSAYLLTHEVEITRKENLAALLLIEEREVTFEQPVKFADCQNYEPLPDPDCTPGAIFGGVIKEIVCVSGYTKIVRNVSKNIKKKVFEMYNIDYPVPFGSYEVDHLIPLSLGGNNEIANLWPKKADSVLGFFEKNVVANYLHEEVCNDKISLSVAQDQIAKDWTAIYKNMDPKIVKQLKIKYPNWADRGGVE